MKITVFTSTYNRAYILENLYHSLQRQTNFDFEWIIVDDGSTDNTKELVNGWLEHKNKFSIVYHYKKNGGKCRAINYALNYAKGELFFTVDSDDYLTNDAIEKIICFENDIVNKKNYCGIALNMITKKNEILNPIFKTQYKDYSMLDRYSYKSSSVFIGHDRAWVFYTDLHRKYLYPEFDGENFLSEAIVWNRMANDGYKIRCFNDAIYVFEQQDDGLTKNIQNIFMNNPFGYCLWKNEIFQFLDMNILDKFKNFYSVYCDLRIRYEIDKIAIYMNKPFALIKLFDLIYKFKHRR